MSLAVILLDFNSGYEKDSIISLTYKASFGPYTVAFDPVFVDFCQSVKIADDGR